MAEPQPARDLLPEDAYDGDDPFDVRLRVAERAVASWRTDTPISREQRRMALLRMLDRLNDEALAFFDRLTAAHEQMQED